MDDFRRRYDVPRRDYGIPGRPQPVQPPANQPAHPTPAPVHHRPAPHHPTQPVHHPRPEGTEAIYAPAPAHQPAARPKPKFGPKASWVVVGILVLVVVVAAFYLLKPSKSKAVLPADLAKQASFRLYYPSPLPPGYTYNQTIATFVNGQAYYEISQGAKHIIVREQSTSASSLDLSSLSSPSDVKTALGKAAVGINTGQTAALVLAGSTLITVNSNGHVPQADMTTFINNLQNLSNP